MDIYDDADWTEMDIDDLKAAIEGGGPRLKKPRNFSAAPTASRTSRTSRANAKSLD